MRIENLELIISYYLCTMKLLKYCLCTLLLVNCGTDVGENHAVRQVAESWADAYFNADYHGAEQYATPESMKWLRFAASNTTKADLELLHEQYASIESDDNIVYSDDTLSIVILTVSDFLAPTTLGDAPRRQDKGTFIVKVVKRDDSWYVRMEGLPRSEKQSHDLSSDE